jgi:hypothetical protein
VAAAVENAIFQWEEAYERLQALRSDPGLYEALGASVVAVEDELRKRLGSSFSIAELAALYEGDPLWASERAREAVQRDSPATDMALAVDAAFYLYMREASDFGGGSLRARRR